MIEIYLLEQLVAVAQHKTLSAAAQSLHISQPALTRSMKKLEQLFGFALFDHHQNRIEINENGKLACEYAHRILHLENEMIEHVTRLEKSRHTIFLESCAPAPMIYIQRQLSLFYPELSVHSQMSDNEEDILKSLQQKHCQLAILSKPAKDTNLISQKIFTEQLYLSVMPAHPAASRKNITFKELDGETFLVDSALGIWKKLVIHMLPHSHFIAQKQRNDLTVLLQSSSLPAFSTDIGWSLYPTEKIRKDILISDSQSSITFYLVYHKKDQIRFGKILET